MLAGPNPPLAVDDVAEVFAGAAVDIDVLANDSDPEDDLLPGSLRILVPPSLGEAAIDGTVVRYTAGEGAGTDRLAYSVCDGEGRCDRGEVVVTVLDVNDPPVATDDEALYHAGHLGRRGCYGQRHRPGRGFVGGRRRWVLPTRWGRSSATGLARTPHRSLTPMPRGRWSTASRTPSSTRRAPPMSAPCWWSSIWVLAQTQTQTRTPSSTGRPAQRERLSPCWRTFPVESSSRPSATTRTRMAIRCRWSSSTALISGRSSTSVGAPTGTSPGPMQTARIR